MTAPSPEQGRCVCGHEKSEHRYVLGCTVLDCACGPGCIHAGFVDAAAPEPSEEERLARETAALTPLVSQMLHGGDHINACAWSRPFDPDLVSRCVDFLRFNAPDFLNLLGVRARVKQELEKMELAARRISEDAHTAHVKQPPVKPPAYHSWLRGRCETAAEKIADLIHDRLAAIEKEQG